MTQSVATRPGRRRRGNHPAGAAPAGSSPDNPIRARGLTKHYGDLVAVDALDLEIRPGEIFGLLGKNGAGKTTTILMLLGLTEPTGGAARVLGMDPTRKPREIKRRVGYLPDAVGFYGRMTGRENLRYTARLNGLPKDAIEGTLDEVLEQVGLTDRADSPTDTYSRGMLQRLGIADALLKEPDVLILDEPTTSIDPLGVIEILALLRQLVDERGMTILLSSHLLGQVQSVCDRVGIFAAGKLIGVGTVTELEERFGDGAAHLAIEVAEQAAGKDPADLRTVLGDIPGLEIGTYDRLTHTWSATVRPASRSDAVREQIVAAAVRSGLRLTGLRQVQASLEDLYRVAVAAVDAGRTTEVPA